MKALVISGGGSKGAFAGGVAQYLIQDLNRKYDLFLGTSTGSLLVSHLALGKIDDIKQFYTSVNQSSIFSNCPFIIKKRHGYTEVSINHFNVLKNLIRKRKSFGDSRNLRKLIAIHSQTLSLPTLDRMRKQKRTAHLRHSPELIYEYRC